MSERVVVVGGGHAAGQLVMALVTAKYSGSVTVVSAEPHPPYQRPPLSKQYLAGGVGLERVHLRPPAFYEKAGVSLRLGVPVEALDREAGRARLADGGVVDYERLVLATGARVRRLTVPGGDLAGVQYLRTIEDADALRRALAPRRRLVIVGGGYIGLEVAAVAARAGVAVTLLEAAPRIMGRVSSELVADYLTAVHRAEGVDIRTGVVVSAFEGGTRVERVLCADGSVFDADCVLVGVGIEPCTELAAGAGLEVDDGIVVDEFTRTADERVLAAGDCTRHPNALMGRRLRLESVHNAVSQARAAAAVLTGAPRAYAEAPWFWSDQYDHTLQTVGLLQGHDRTVLRGEPGAGPFLVFYLREGTVIAVDAVDAARDFMHCKRLVSERARVDPERLTDTGVPVSEL